jgi:chemotaxis-related protein WspD
MSRRASTAATTTAPAQPVIDACWNRIGVHGDRSCPTLAEVTRCRNCPVYATAATELLDRAAPEGYFREASRHFAQPTADAAPDAQSAFIFRIGAEWLALGADVLDEVAELGPIHSLPHRRDGVVLGVGNVRGELLVCIALDQLLGIGAARATERSARRVALRRLLVLRHEGQRVVAPVDEVHGSHAYAPGQLQAVPATVAKASPCYTRAILPWRKQAVGLLDAPLLMYTLGRSLG